MTTARTIVGGALTFWLNRLSPGETLDADVAATCLTALNDITDEINGGESLLFREVRIPGVCNGVSGTLGTTWAGIGSGNDILGATVSYQAGMEIPISSITMGQYQDIAQKATVSIPQFYCHDGASTVYLWPAAAGQTITLLTRQSFANFADLDTDYSMPSGFQSGLTAMLAERMASVLLGGIPPAVAKAANGARMRLQAQTSNPEILNAVSGGRYNIYTNSSGWN